MINELLQERRQVKHVRAGKADNYNLNKGYLQDSCTVAAGSLIWLSRTLQWNWATIHVISTQCLSCLDMSKCLLKNLLTSCCFYFNILKTKLCICFLFAFKIISMSPSYCFAPWHLCLQILEKKMDKDCRTVFLEKNVNSNTQMQSLAWAEPSLWHVLWKSFLWVPMRLQFTLCILTC